MIEPSSVLNGGKFSFGAAAHPMEQGEDRLSNSLSYVNTTEEKYSDNISSASEASESTGSGTYNQAPMGLSNVFCLLILFFVFVFEIELLCEALEPVLKLAL